MLVLLGIPQVQVPYKGMQAVASLFQVLLRLPVQAVVVLAVLEGASLQQTLQEMVEQGY
jgi:hypothetical protein